MQVPQSFLDLTPYSDLGFGKTINEMVSKHSVAQKNRGNQR